MEKVKAVVAGQAIEPLMEKAFQVGKVNQELEDKNKRLKIYNAELRTALVEAQSINQHRHRLINTLDCDIKEQGALNMLSENDSEQSSNVFTNGLIVDKIFGYLGIKKLQKCRLVSKAWNEIASSILRKTNNGNGVPIIISLIHSNADGHLFLRWTDNEAPIEEDDLEEDLDEIEGGEEGYDNLIVPDEELVTTQELYSIVKNGPKDWFKTLEFSPGCLESPPFIKVLEDFGNQLKVVRITTYYLQIQQLQNILIDWCPNIEEFKFTLVTSVKGETSELNIPPTQSLKLTYLSYGTRFGKQCHAVKTSEILFKILTSSPHLKTLEFLRTNTPFTITHLFSKLQLFPNVLGNLEKIFLANSFPRSPRHDDRLKELSQLEFQSKLKQFVSTSIIQNDGTALSSLLSKTAETLEKLTLTSRETIEDVPLFVPYRSDLRLQFNEMKNLHEFKYFAHRQSLIDSVDVIAKMPNLKTFMIGFDHPYSLACRKGDLMDDLFCNCEKLLATPHTSLKELYIFGFIQKPATTFGLINKCFPNLNKFGVSIRRIKQYKDPEGLYYGEFFKGISELKHLSQLYLEWKNNLYDVYQHLTLESFGELAKLEKLVHLTIRTGCGIKDFEEDVLSFPKLQRLTLVDISMGLVNAQKFREKLSKQNMFLEVKDDCFRRTDRYSFEMDANISHFAN